jgi:lysophospholipase
MITGGFALASLLVHWAAEAGRMTRFVRSGAASIAVPVLVLRPEVDAYVDEAGVDEFCRKLPNCRRVFLKGARHEILIERDELRSFLKEQSRERRARRRRVPL